MSGQAIFDLCADVLLFSVIAWWAYLFWTAAFSDRSGGWELLIVTDQLEAAQAATDGWEPFAVTRIVSEDRDGCQMFETNWIFRRRA